MIWGSNANHLFFGEGGVAVDCFFKSVYFLPYWPRLWIGGQKDRIFFSFLEHMLAKSQRLP